MCAAQKRLETNVEVDVIVKDLSQRGEGMIFEKKNGRNQERLKRRDEEKNRRI